MAVLNTNTRYLHDHLVSYAERLCALLPAPLSVCYVVCSGSEANELALRLARADTRHSDFIFVEGAYHGNTKALVDISPYKFDGQGGGGSPPHVHKVRMPDLYRGCIAAATGRRAASTPWSWPTTARRRRLRPGLAAFICESLLSCGGQIVLPDGYLAGAYRAVRERGGVCIADEVQVGFGRVGGAMWAFSRRASCLISSRWASQLGTASRWRRWSRRRTLPRFANGMEDFNTFGGNPVSCAVGLAVLDVMRDEKLQERALTVGGHLSRGLESLMARFPIIGDVRGLGLFLGIELVRDRVTLEPAAAQAGYVVNRMRDRGILVSTDGPLRNVIKIKPPLPFSRENADRLVDTLAAILQEDPARP